jgi:hypothetical protein
VDVTAVLLILAAVRFEDVRIRDERVRELDGERARVHALRQMQSFTMGGSCRPARTGSATTRCEMGFPCLRVLCWQPQRYVFFAMTSVCAGPRSDERKET